MDVVSLAMSQAYTRKQSRLDKWLRALHYGPGLAGIPTVMASPYSISISTAAATGQTAPASAISSAVHVYPHAPDITITGSVMVDGPLVAGSVWSLMGYGASTGPQQSQSPYTVSCYLDTVGGAFDVVLKDLTATEFRIAVDGQYLAQAGHVTPGNTALAVIAAVSGLSAGRHHVQVELGAEAVFCGFNIGPRDQMHPTAKPDLRVVVVGDSMSAPTVLDSATNYMKWGWPQILGQMLGVEVISSGGGGTGYCVDGALDRVRIGTRVEADTPDDTDVIIWTAGLNDYALHSTEVGAAAEACIQTMLDALPNALQIMTGPIWTQGNLSVVPELWTVRDQLADAADTYSLPFIDWIESTPQQLTTQVAGTLTSSSLASASTLSSSVSFNAGTLIRIGSGTGAEIRAVLAVSGSGPYTLTLDGVAQLAHASGSTVVPTGAGWVTGTGDQGATTGLGTGDRYTGPDGTHPSSDLAASGGHPALARYIYGQLARTDF